MLNDTFEHIISADSEGNSLNGGKTYRLTLPRGIPECDFWSVLVYDSDTRLIIKTDQPWPSIHSDIKKLHTNSDGSVDIWFGPIAPERKESNWIKTIRGKNWYSVLRIYNLTNIGLNHWMPGEIKHNQ